MEAKKGQKLSCINENCTVGALQNRTVKIRALQISFVQMSSVKMMAAQMRVVQMRYVQIMILHSTNEGCTSEDDKN